MLYRSIIENTGQPLPWRNGINQTALVRIFHLIICSIEQRTTVVLSLGNEWNDHGLCSVLRQSAGGTDISMVAVLTCYRYSSSVCCCHVSCLDDAVLTSVFVTCIMNTGHRNAYCSN